jgi:hypothetical protein
MPKFFTTCKRILTPGALNENQLLIVLQKLIVEVNRNHGYAHHLLPEWQETKNDFPLTLEDTNHYKNWNDIITQKSPLHNQLTKILKWALDTLPNQPDATWKLLQTQKALRKIARQWKRRKEWNHASTQNACISMARILNFRQRTFAKPYGEDPKATRIHKTRILINAEGKIEVIITYGYPRNNDTNTNHITYATPDGPQALTQTADEIEALLVPIKPQEENQHTAKEHWETINREAWYHRLTNPCYDKTTNTCTRGLRTQGHFANGRLTPDKETKEAFGNIEYAPYTRKEEVASMLADLLERNDVTEAEMEILTASLKTARELATPNATLNRFRKELNNRNHALRFDHIELAKPNYQILEQGIQEAKNSNAKIFVWIPHTNKQPGWMRVPWTHVRLNKSTNKITYRKHTFDIGVIQQFDVLPKNHTSLLAKI